MKWSIFTLDEEAGEHFYTLFEAIQYVLDAIEQSPLDEFNEILLDDRGLSKSGRMYSTHEIDRFKFKIMNLQTGEIIWEESNL